MPRTFLHTAIRGFRAPLAAASAAAMLALPGVALEQGDAAPRFSAPGVSGGVVSLDAHRGKVIMVDFWASWCGPCAQSLPALDALRKEFPADDFQVIAVNVDSESEQAKAFLKRRPVGYPSALDPEGLIPTRFGLQTMPTSYLIDRNGVVRHIHRGFRPDDIGALRERIQALVAASR
jgi:thiol-disulfide isomerase/thioredoxin